MLLSGWYTKIVWSDNQQQYYRLYNDFIPEKRSDGYYNTWADKNLYLQVFDRSFNIIGEYPLPKHTFGRFHIGSGPEGANIFFLKERNKEKNQKVIMVAKAVKNN